MKVKTEIAKEQFSVGVHKGVITRTEYREVTFSGRNSTYVDFFIEGNNGQNLSTFSILVNSVASKEGKPISQLSKLMYRFGFDVSKDIDPDYLIGKECSFFVNASLGKDGKEYLEVLKDTVKPVVSTVEEVKV